jgi:hypothetical protein
VLELAQAPEVRSEGDMARLYERIGRLESDGRDERAVRRYETTAARGIERDILQQLRRPSSASARR